MSDLTCRFCFRIRSAGALSDLPNGFGLPPSRFCATQACNLRYIRPRWRSGLRQWNSQSLGKAVVRRVLMTGQVLGSDLKQNGRFTLEASWVDQVYEVRSKPPGNDADTQRFSIRIATWSMWIPAMLPQER